MIGRPLAELGAVDWASLSHAYGSAEDVPAQLRALAAGDDEAYDDAFGNLWHQWTVYSATPHAIPFLIGMLEAGTRNADLLHLLGCMGRGEGQSREAVQEALAVGLEVFIPLLHSKNAEEASAAAYLLGSLGQREARAVAALQAAAQSVTVPEVEATCAYHLRRSGLEEATRNHLWQRLHESDSGPLRLACALALAHDQKRDAPPTAAQVLREALAGAQAEDWLAELHSDPDDPLEVLAEAARQLGQAEDFARLFLQQAQASGDGDGLVYAFELAHPEQARPLTPLAREILGTLLNQSRLAGYALWLGSHGLPTSPEALRAYLQKDSG